MVDSQRPNPESKDDRAPPAKTTEPALEPKKWGEPLMAADRVWTRFEIWLAMLAFGLEVFSMALWVCLKGFSAAPDHPGAAIFRGIVGATIFGVTAHLALAKKTPSMRRNATLAGVFLGFAISKTWIHFGVDYASNLLNWYQQASFLTLLGGLRGVGTRLTMLLALIGGSLATARGRHIVIDVVTRFVNHGIRRVMVLVGWAAAAVVCVTAAWGFFDHISIENFGARADDSAGSKIAQVGRVLGEDLFTVRKQIALDFKSTPHVVFRGEVYSDWLTGKQWNAWLDDEGFAERFGKEPTDGIKIPETETKAPLVVIPGRGEPRGELINVGYLVFPIGLLVIALRFILRGLLVLSNQVSVETDESEDWNENAPRAGEEPVGDYE